VTRSLDALAALRPDERARLERFAAAFERVDASRYPAFTEVAPGPEVAEAQERALEVLGKGVRRAAVRAAVDAFVDAAAQAYSRRMSLTDMFLLFQSSPESGADRARFLATVERAVVGLILWDELDADDLAALLGPWSALGGNDSGGSMPAGH
jgi:hypothetical protein